MTVDGRLEGLYQQVQLVRGAGDRKRGQLCIMSFVAFLAGEGHTDNPMTASRLIRRFAMVINDGMPDHLRQRLKSFAPRIIGTRDGQDNARAELLLEATRTEILPHIVEGFNHSLPEAGLLLTLGADHHVSDSLHELVQKVVDLGSPAGELVGTSSEEVASALAQLLSHCAKIAAPARAEWYWLKAIELLDRLCEVGGDSPRSEIYAERVASLEAFLNRRAEIQRRKTRTFEALGRIRNIMPAFIR